MKSIKGEIFMFNYNKVSTDTNLAINKVTSLMLWCMKKFISHENNEVTFHQNTNVAIFIEKLWVTNDFIS